MLFLWHYGSITFFPHYHTVDGVTIAHSHPFNKSSDTGPVNHQHTSNTFILIHLISVLIAIAPVLYFLMKVIRIIAKDLFIISDENIERGYSRSWTYLLRAPPVKLYS